MLKTVQGTYNGMIQNSQFQYTSQEYTNKHIKVEKTLEKAFVHEFSLRSESNSTIYYDITNIVLKSS